MLKALKKKKALETLRSLTQKSRPYTSQRQNTEESSSRIVNSFLTDRA